MNSYDVIRKPVISEMSMDQAAEKKYTFIVDKNATKDQIKKSISDIFEVDIKSINVMNRKGKLKRQGAKAGRRPDTKKAIVTLTEDSKAIEFFEAM